MSSKRRIRRRSCEGKVNYPDKATAIHNAGILRKTHQGGTWRAYRCEFCGGWHVGRPSRRDNQALAARRAAEAA